METERTPEEREFRRYAIAHASIAALAVLHAVIFCLAAWTLSRSEGDPVRKGVRWLKSGLTFLSIATLLMLAGEAIILYLTLQEDLRSWDTLETLLLVSVHTILLFQVFYSWARAVLLVTLMEYIVGVSRIHRGGSRGWHSFVRYITFLLAFIISVLAVASYGYIIQRTRRDNLSWIVEETPEFRDISTIYTAVNFVTWGVALFITGVTGLVMIQTYSTFLQEISLSMLGANLLNLLATSYHVGWFIQNKIDPDVRESLKYGKVLDLALSLLVTCFAYVVCWYISVKKARGLWSPHDTLTSEPSETTTNKVTETFTTKTTTGRFAP